VGAKVRLPTEEELRTLPRWARVAFALRCALRVRPLLTHFWPDAPRKRVEAIDRALTLTQAAVESPASVSEGRLRSAAAAAAAAHAARDAHADAHAAAHAAARATADAADAAADDAYAYAADDAYAYAAYAANAARDAAAYAAHAAVAAYAARATATAAAALADIADAMRHDCELLRALAEAERWGDESGVDLGRLGALWPEGEPEGWPARDEDGEPSYLKVEIAVPAGLDGEELRSHNERVAAFFAELSALHTAMGGNGLKLLDADSVETVPREDEAPDWCPVDESGVGR
jgi:hypothetical protein